MHCGRRKGEGRRENEKRARKKQPNTGTDTDTHSHSHIATHTPIVAQVLFVEPPLDSLLVAVN